MRQATILTLACGLAWLFAAAPSAQAQCVQSQGGFTAELLVDGGNSDGTFTYVWGVTFNESSAWLTNLWFQSSGDPVASVTVLPEYTRWSHSSIASAPGNGQPAEYFTYQSGFKLQRGRSFTFAYTTSFTDPVQVRARDSQGTIYGASFTSASCGNLPVELTSFVARADGDAAQVAWETASETNNAGFNVEVRAAGDDVFRVLGFVQGAGTTVEAQRYTFRTAPLAPGRYTFRLQQVDFDGAASFSAPVELEIAHDAAVYVAPFPSVLRDAADLSFSVARAEHVQVRLFNVLGQQVASLFDGAVSGGETVHATLDGSGLPSGVYFLRIEGDTFGHTERVTIVR